MRVYIFTNTKGYLHILIRIKRKCFSSFQKKKIATFLKLLKQNCFDLSLKFYFTLTFAHNNNISGLEMQKLVAV